jgi:hypothetical protein
LQGVGVDVKGDELMPGSEQSRGHVTAHATEADESDGLFVAHGCFLTNATRRLWKAQIVKEARPSD